MKIETGNVVSTLLASPDSDKLIQASRHILRDDAVLFAINTLWVQYARTEVDVLKSQREDREEVAEHVRNKRLALDDLLDELGNLAEAEASEDATQENE